MDQGLKEIMEQAIEVTGMAFKAASLPPYGEDFAAAATATYCQLLSIMMMSRSKAPEGGVQTIKIEWPK